MKPGVKVTVKEYFELNCVPIHAGDILTIKRYDYSNTLNEKEKIIEFEEHTGWFFSNDELFEKYFKVINDKPKYSEFLEKLGTISLLILFSLSTYANERDNERRAQKESIRAIRSYEQVKDMEKTLINRFASKTSKTTGVDKGSLKILGAMGITAAQGRVSTKDLPIRRRVGGVTIVPLVEHNFSGNALGTSGGLGIRYEF